MSAIGSGPVAIDACILIYFIERNSRYSPLIHPLFAQAAAGERGIWTSALSLLEITVGPLREGNVELCKTYDQRLTGSRDLKLVPIQLDSLRLAAGLRADYRVSTPDALQLAAAMESGCGVFLTNDRRIPAVAGLTLVQLEDFVVSS